MATLWLKKDLVALFLSKFDNLILNRRAVAWPRAFDFPRIHGRFIEVITNDVVGLGAGVGDVAGDLFHVERRTFRR